MTEIQIKDNKIGKDNPCFIVAEMSANHNKNFENAKQLITLSKQVGADAIKVQTYTPDTLTLNIRNKYFMINNGPWAGISLYELYQKAYTPWEWQSELKKIADDLGIVFFSTPFDKSAVDFLEKLDVSLYKVASFEIIDIPLLKYVASTKKPIFLSTGMSSLSEIDEAVQAIRGEGNNQIALLKCTSAYPAPIGQMNLLSIPFLSEMFGVPSGLSDHSIHNEISIGAVALGANIIERHFIHKKSDGGPDALFSADFKEFKQMVKSIRNFEMARGTVHFGSSGIEDENVIFRRSLFFTCDINKGEKIEEEMVRSIRPGYGIPPKYISNVIGKTATDNFKKGTPITFEILYSLKSSEKIKCD